uniref:Putative ovule protein n=1 Tax=Solanum chacoense TaxID=4108 RepID=A0A0V0HXW6_SOLCH
MEFYVGNDFFAVNIPVVSLNEDGRMVLVSEDNIQLKLEKQPVNTREKKTKIELSTILLNVLTSQELHPSRSYSRGRIYNGNGCNCGIGFVLPACFTL